MALARAHAMALVGVQGYVVEIEADIENGLVALMLVGLPDTALREARDRIRAAIVNSGESWPNSKITVGLSPAALPKRGSGFDLAIAVAILAADDSLLATHRDGERLTPEHGFPLRLVIPSLYAWKSVKWVRAIEYMTVDRRGFWEERGYHNVADPWREQRYSYQENAGDGPPA